MFTIQIGTTSYSRARTTTCEAMSSNDLKTPPQPISSHPPIISILIFPATANNGEIIDVNMSHGVKESRASRHIPLKPHKLKVVDVHDWIPCSSGPGAPWHSVKTIGRVIQKLSVARSWMIDNKQIGRIGWMKSTRFTI
jgi:hypothetical protein